MTEFNEAPASRAYDVVVLGAGYAGLMAALRLRRAKRGLRIALISAADQLIERVRLQETIVRPLAPRIASIPGESGLTQWMIQRAALCFTICAPSSG